MYSRLISALFYMFFTCVILNPQVNGITLYFYLLIPFLDPEFARFLSGTARRWAGPLLIAVVASGLTSPSAAVRVLSIAICIGYLMYTAERRISYLHPWMVINILFAIVQFAMYYIDRDFAMQLGPTNLAKLIWGNYATSTYTNFFEVFYFARVSGFSREAGFFSSLLVTSFIVYLLSDSPNKKIIAIYLIGLFISFSKSSMTLFLFAALYPVRARLRSVHPLMTMVAYFAVTAAISVYLASNDFFDSETFGHRLAGYAFLFDARLGDIVSGITAHDIITHYKYLPYIRLIQGEMEDAGVPFAGLAATVAEMGIFSALILFGVIAFTASDGFVMLIFLLISATVSVTTVTSFIPLAYVICYWPRFSAYSAHRVELSRQFEPLPRYGKT
ncbi:MULTISPECIES: hypothetical protein [Paraburkholderia]|uniref:hypothetical protein n=1 Tax=Paraburkholderia TaxID=1822464 RepID=UPI0015C52BE3|nr:MULTISPECIES: hypothetical protein [Paraburkholderia]MCX4173962.1 hypothetical protein [Paraburkholderia madseniana]MDQ6461966.1 hypothetical protein [Paraburkholderia madseniana]NPT66610.1 hypothetical protein [Paraburkholderia madseniana]